MDMSSLKSLSENELKMKIKNWKNESQRLALKKDFAEIKDTTVFKELRKNVARAYTVLNECQTEEKKS